MIRFNVCVSPEEIVYSNENCKLKINNGELENGTLLMTANDICWKNQESEEGFMIPWQKITVQAITQEPQRCVYFMIDVVWPGAENRNGDTNGNSEDEGNCEDDAASEESLAEITEFHIVPESSEAVDEIYYIMTKYPVDGPMDDDSDEEGFLDGDQMEQMNIEDEDDDRFEDP